MPREVLFFADRLPPLVGGVETHAEYFIENFTQHPLYPLAAVVTKNSLGLDCLVTEKGMFPMTLEEMRSKFDPAILFFNSGRWIEELIGIRRLFPLSRFIYRTGGNEILKASLIHSHIADHPSRQHFWVTTLNQTIDLLITNSAYTEQRLRELGITCPFARCVGGVNVNALRSGHSASPEPLTIFCAARFVPYKNHPLFLAVMKNLIVRGHKLRVRLAGDGPLQKQAKEQVDRDHLSSFIEFLGPLDNERACREIAQADIYMQLSGDVVTEVPGGSYVHSEGMGRSILEAISAGTFVIAGSSGALPEIVTPDRGSLLDLDDVSQITEKIDMILKKPPKKGKFTDTYSWRNIFNRYEELFHEIAARH